MTGKQLKEKLALLPVSQKAIADAIGIPAQQLTRIFKQDDVKTGVLEAICASQGLHMSFFYPTDDVIVQNNINHVRARNINTVSGDISGDATNNDRVQSSPDTDITVKALLEQNAELIKIIKEKL